MDSKSDTTIFISYAWGGSAEKKEWIRDHVVNSIDFKYNVFWDRDSIGFGESIDSMIKNALSSFPLKVFCICDEDYIVSAKKVNSGLHRELQMLANLGSDNEVKIIPIILDRKCITELPPPLAGRAYLDLTDLHERGLYLGNAIWHLAENITQAKMLTWIKLTIEKDDLHRAALDYFYRKPLRFSGNAITHQICINYTQILLAPKWMWDSPNWNYMLNDDNDIFCPTKGRWHWDHYSAGTAMKTLGTVMISQFFPEDACEEVQWALESIGVLLAVKIISMIRKDEPFILEPKEIIMYIINDEYGSHALKHLLKHYS
ncbi:toll/interleukin-1 receptor domain-containing protein [Pantoea sp. USHLN298]|uniref:toll/interleukin-1 receptor domain-containing protein n=1 Tax=Pantoea sp. USHLN298 TaxID=3081294 RepID=UPI0030163F7E